MSPSTITVAPTEIPAPRDEGRGYAFTGCTVMAAETAPEECDEGRGFAMTGCTVM
ncbi:MAG: hypothetical protein Q9172_005017 [Xanthocarpia lactea]